MAESLFSAVSSTRSSDPVASAAPSDAAIAPLPDPASEDLGHLYQLSEEELLALAGGGGPGELAAGGPDEARRLAASVEDGPLDAEQTTAVALAAAAAADDRKGGDVLLLDMVEVSYLADYFLLVTGFSRSQVRAIADAITERLESEFNRVPRNRSGYSEAAWVLLDYGDVIVHVLMPAEREFYNLEAFWSQARRVELPTAALESEGIPSVAVG